MPGSLRSPAAPTGPCYARPAGCAASEALCTSCQPVYSTVLSLVSAPVAAFLGMNATLTFKVARACAGCNVPSGNLTAVNVSTFRPDDFGFSCDGPAGVSAAFEKPSRADLNPAVSSVTVRSKLNGSSAPGASAALLFCRLVLNMTNTLSQQFAEMSFSVSLVQPPVCGNGVRETGEGCDDGNAQNGDGCSGACSIELGYDCNGVSPAGRSTCSRASKTDLPAAGSATAFVRASVLLGAAGLTTASFDVPAQVSIATPPHLECKGAHPTHPFLRHPPPL